MKSAKNTDVKENTLMNSLQNKELHTLSEFERQLCNIQGKMFVLSVKKNYSSREFIDFFMNSKTAAYFDLPFDRTQWLGEENLLCDVTEENPELKTGETYDIDCIFWIGYIYRYWHFLKGQTSREINEICNAETMKILYPAYHTLDCKQAIERILEATYM